MAAAAATAGVTTAGRSAGAAPGRDSSARRRPMVALHANVRGTAAAAPGAGGGGGPRAALPVAGPPAQALFDRQRAAEAQRMFAVVVTNVAFKDKFVKPLPGLVEVLSTAVSKVLKHPDLCGLPPDHVIHLKNASTRAFRNALRSIAKRAGPNDSVLVVVTSRGVRIRYGLHRGSYVLMHDTLYTTTNTELAQTALGVKAFKALLSKDQGFKTDKICLVMDVCHRDLDRPVRGSAFSQRMHRVYDKFFSQLHAACRCVVLGPVDPLAAAKLVDTRKLPHHVDAMGSTFQHTTDFLQDLLSGLAGGAALAAQAGGCAPDGSAPRTRAGRRLHMLSAVTSAAAKVAAVSRATGKAHTTPGAAASAFASKLASAVGRLRDENSHNSDGGAGDVAHPTPPVASVVGVVPLWAFMWRALVLRQARYMAALRIPVPVPSLVPVPTAELKATAEAGAAAAAADEAAKRAAAQPDPAASKAAALAAVQGGVEETKAEAEVPAAVNVDGVASPPAPHLPAVMGHDEEATVSVAEAAVHVDAGAGGGEAHSGGDDDSGDGAGDGTVEGEELPTVEAGADGGDDADACTEDDATSGGNDVRSVASGTTTPSHVAAVAYDTEAVVDAGGDGGGNDAGDGSDGAGDGGGDEAPRHTRRSSHSSRCSRRNSKSRGLVDGDDGGAGDEVEAAEAAEAMQELLEEKARAQATMLMQWRVPEPTQQWKVLTEERAVLAAMGVPASEVVLSPAGINLHLGMPGGTRVKGTVPVVAYHLHGDVDSMHALFLPPRPPNGPSAPACLRSSMHTITAEWVNEPHTGFVPLYHELQVRGHGRAVKNWRRVSPPQPPYPLGRHSFTMVPALQTLADGLEVPDSTMVARAALLRREKQLAKKTKHKFPLAEGVNPLQPPDVELDLSKHFCHTNWRQNIAPMPSEATPTHYVQSLAPDCAYFMRVRSWSPGGWSVFSVVSERLYSRRLTKEPLAVQVRAAAADGPVALLALLHRHCLDGVAQLLCLEELVVLLTRGDTARTARQLADAAMVTVLADVAEVAPLSGQVVGRCVQLLWLLAAAGVPYRRPSVLREAQVEWRLVAIANAALEAHSTDSRVVVFSRRLLSAVRTETVAA